MNTPSADDLGAVLLGKTRGAVLGLLFGRPDEEFHVRQIARLTGATLGPVQRELKLLAQIDVLHCREVGHQLLYSANQASPVHQELRSFVVKTVGLVDVLRAAMKPLSAQVRAAFVFGSFAQGRQQEASDVDVMVIGDVSLAAVAKALTEAQRRLSREINPTIYRPAEFAAKLREGHHFLNAVMDGPKLFLIGGPIELSRLAEERLVALAQNQSPGDRRPARRH
jgi:predicted nucleotidyltransferase